MPPLTRQQATKLKRKAWCRLRTRRTLTVCIRKLQRRVRERLLRDPITLECIRRRFCLVRGQTTIVFDASALYAYIRASGDYCDPVTRGTYSAPELLRLARANQRPHRELVHSYETWTAKREQMHTRMSLEAALEVEMGERVWDFIDKCKMEYSILRFVEFRWFFVQCYHNLRAVNRTACADFLVHTMERIRKDVDAASNMHVRLEVMGLLRTLKSGLLERGR